MGILAVNLAGFGWRSLSVAALCLLAISAAAAQDAASLTARHAALQEQLANNQFQRPLYLESRETSGVLHGDIYAVVNQPYSVVGPDLQDVNHWCDILMLHLNVKSCQIASAKAGNLLRVNIGRKTEQAVADTHMVKFQYQVLNTTKDYFQVALGAKDGPLGTSNYQITLEAVSIAGKRSFLHLAYSYASGLAAKLALQGYLATVGRDKVGFTIVGHKPTGEPIYIGSKRGVIERNTMRYYLAIEAYLGALSAPLPQQLDKRLSDWYAGVERYPRQLHELERGEYLAMKHKEINRLAQLDPVAAE